MSLVLDFLNSKENVFLYFCTCYNMIACSIPDYVKMIPEKKRLVHLYAVATNFFVLCIEISTFQHWWYILYKMCLHFFTKTRAPSGPSLSCHSKVSWQRLQCNVLVQDSNQDIAMRKLHLHRIMLSGSKLNSSGLSE